MGGLWTDEEILEAIHQRRWYHKIPIRPGITTPGNDYDRLWDIIRAARKHIDYTGKRVLDIASFDGLWAFEAERLGASFVVATDCYQPAFANFALCKEILKSNVVPLYNVSPYSLWDGLKVILMDDESTPLPYPQQVRHNLFDIVQHLGLLYHVRDPLMTLSQSRSVIKTGGFLLLETAAILNPGESLMVYNGPPENKKRIYLDVTTWWIPTIQCVMEMLKTTLFEPMPETIHILEDQPISGYPLGRMAVVAKAVPGHAIAQDTYKELLRTFRNPGLVPEYL